jgi:hypothetical protein
VREFYQFTGTTPTQFLAQLEGLLAARPADRWMLANAHIGMLQAPAGPLSQ